ncbi:aspartoacylase [Prochlorococcus marinus]|uniref:aspartoacylase n=1 Tax=Prochlorococcus marinus TaxID=1219 RepID=UPI0022B32880|nr:aspartoacylase [Prochlorococcus marinus]
MMQLQVLLVAGTHGNEINGIFLFDQWQKSPLLINTHGIKTCKVIGNPEAQKAGKRYIHQDLNRSFQEESFLSISSSNFEGSRANELVNLYGEVGEKPCQIALDFHTTTASMGSCLVVYGRRNADLALASLIQNQLGLPIYLHESDQKQTGFLVESWPCGLVIEIGPIGQGLLNSRIISQTKLILETLMEQIHQVHNLTFYPPDKLIIHRHIKSIDFPRDEQGNIDGYVHSLRQSKDWQELKKNDELFFKSNGEIIRFEEEEPYVPVFINEAAYVEKNIAMSFTKRELWDFKKEWKQSLIDLVHQK